MFLGMSVLQAAENNAPIKGIQESAARSGVEQETEEVKQILLTVSLDGEGRRLVCDCPHESAPESSISPGRPSLGAREYSLFFTLTGRTHLGGFQRPHGILTPISCGRFSSWVGPCAFPARIRIYGNGFTKAWTSYSSSTGFFPRKRRGRTSSFRLRPPIRSLLPIAMGRAFSPS